MSIGGRSGEFGGAIFLSRERPRSLRKDRGNAHGSANRIGLPPRSRFLTVTGNATPPRDPNDDSKSAGCSHLTRRLSGPALERMRECTHLMKAEEPRNLGDMQLVVIEVTNRQIAAQLLKYF